jgi:hypothetical protein
MGRPPRVDHLRDWFLGSIDSAEWLVDAVKPLSAFNPATQQRSLHPKHVYRIVELAFLGLVATWEEFLESTFVRYLAGAQSDNGYKPAARVGYTKNIEHSYQVISGNPAYDVESDFLKFSDAKWTMGQARIYFEAGRPYATYLGSKLDRLSDAAVLRNRVAHSSDKARADFYRVALNFLAPPTGQLTQGFGVGELLMSEAVRHFGQLAAQNHQSFFKAFAEMYRTLANSIVS